jgi:heme-degrading monooxygenase HmoA
MIAVIFEVIPHDEHKDAYFKIAAELKPILEKVEGFISVERFQSIIDPGKILSLSFWKDEASVERWRNIEVHRSAQSEGRKNIFKDYNFIIA